MTLFEQIKNIPKVDMHINLTGSISTDLAFDLTESNDIVEIVSMMQEKNNREYLNALELPIKILNNSRNIQMAVDNLIDKLKQNNVLYAELFLDLLLYNDKIDEEKILKTILEVKEKRDYPLQVV